MKKILPILLIILLAGSGYFIYNLSQKNIQLQKSTSSIENFSELEQQLSGLIDQFSGLQRENETLKQNLSGQLSNLQTLQQENETLKADVDKYKKMIVDDKLSSKNTNTNSNTTNTTSSTNTANNTVLQKNAGYIKEVYINGDKKYLKIDYVEFGGTGPGGAPESINNNTLIRTFEIDNNATFVIQKQILTKPNVWRDSYTQSNGISNREEFMYWANHDFKFLTDNCSGKENDERGRCPIDYYVGGGKEAIVEITHDGNKIHKVAQLYRP